MTAAAPGRPPPAAWIVALLVAVTAALWTWASKPPSAFAFAENALLRAALLGQLAALYRGRAVLASLVGPTTRPRAWALGAIVAGALAVRCGVEALPWHAYNWLESLAQRTDPEPAPWWYANGFGVSMRVPMLLGLDVERAIFLGNRVAGALGCLALYALDRALCGDERKALWSAGLLAFLPLHVRLSASETMQVLPGLFSLLGLFGFAAHARTNDQSLLAAGALAMFYGALCRPEAALLFPAVPLLYVGRASWRRLFQRPFLLAYGLASALAVPLVAHGARQKMNGVSASHYLQQPVATFANFVEAVASSGWPTSWIGGAALPGFVILVARGRAAGLVAPAAFLLLLVELAGFDENFANRWQLLVPQIPLILLAASALPALLGELADGPGAPRRAARALGAALVVAALALSARAPIYHRLYDQQIEYRFLDAHRALYASMGPQWPLVRPAPAGGEGALAVFPAYRLPRGTRVASLVDLLEGRVPLPAIYYRGLSCARSERPVMVGVPQEHAHCDDVEARFELQPVDRLRVTAPSFVGFPREGHRADEAVEIGLYRVLRRRP